MKNRTQLGHQQVLKFFLESALKVLGVKKISLLFIALRGGDSHDKGFQFTDMLALQRQIDTKSVPKLGVTVFEMVAKARA